MENNSFTGGMIKTDPDNVVIATELIVKDRNILNLSLIHI